LLEISQGRALLLFTSFKGMDEMAAFLETSSLPHPILVQGRSSRQALLEQFKKTTDSVLLAVASFWEGVDIQGESLSCVMIDKLPFEVPSDPVLQARMKAITEAGGKPFFDLQVPRAILTLRQGAGRLMRATSDYGVIAIMDVRLFSKGYGRAFRASLPPSPVVRSLEEVRHFFEQLEEMDR
jgi:ATP-dependent DNA helicase DinG